MEVSTLPNRKRGRPIGSGEQDGRALRQITLLRSNDKTLSDMGAIKQVPKDASFVAKKEGDANFRRLRDKRRFLRKGLKALLAGFPDDDGAVEMQLKLFARSGFRWQVVDGEVRVSPPAIIP